MSYLYGYRNRYDALRWYHILPVRDTVDRKTQMVDESYDLIFGSEPATLGWRKCETGYTNFQSRVCWVNTELLKDAQAQDQYVMTVFLAAHERAHARWTEFVESDFNALDKNGKPILSREKKPVPDPLLHNVWNILEDERIERLLGRDFAHLHKYLKKGSELFLPKIKTPAGTNAPTEVIEWILRRRVAERAGLKEKCPLSRNNQDLLAKCEPLLDEAFGCTSSRRVVEISREILKILQLDGMGAGGTVYEILSGMEGDRGEGDEAESDGASKEDGELYSAGDIRELTKDLAEELEDMLTSHGYSPDVRRGGDITPAPYEELLRQVRPLVAPVRQLFIIPPSKRVVEYEETGARLSIRAVRRTPKTPFRIDTPPEKKGRVALTMVIDDSGSMGGTREQQAKLTALLCNEALAGGHKVRAVLAPSGRVAVDSSLKEMSRAYLAGYDSSYGTEYATVMKQELAKLKKLGRGYTRYLVLVADGASGQDDGVACARLVVDARKNGIHTFGIGIELDVHSAHFYQGIFGAQYIDLKSATELPARMQAILRRVAHNKKHVTVAS